MTSILVVRRGRQATGVEVHEDTLKWMEGPLYLISLHATENELSWHCQYQVSLHSFCFHEAWLKKKARIPWRSRRPANSIKTWLWSQHTKNTSSASIYLCNWNEVAKWPQSDAFFQHQTVINGEFYWSTLNREQSLESQTYYFLLSVPPKGLAMWPR